MEKTRDVNNEKCICAVASYWDALKKKKTYT